MKSLRTADVQFLFAVAVGMLMVSHWTRDLPWFPAIVLGVGGITIAHTVIREGTRWLLSSIRRTVTLDRSSLVLNKRQCGTIGP